MLRKLKPYIKKLQEISEKDFELVGQEALGFSQIVDLASNTPDSMVVTSLAFDDFLMANNLIDPILRSLQLVQPFVHESARNAAGEISNYIMSAYIPDVIAQDIKKSYESMSRLTKSPLVNLSLSQVITQSFVSSNVRTMTYDDIYGIEELLMKVKLAWKSLFSTESIEIRTNNYYKGPISTAILLRKVIRNEISAISYSIPPITKEDGTIEIHSLFGVESQNEHIASDMYKIDIVSGNVREKIIVDQEHMFVRQGVGDDKKGSLLKVPISKKWKSEQKIDDKKILALASEHLKLEQKIGSPLVVKWAIEAGEVFITDVEVLPKRERKLIRENLQETVDKDVLKKSSENKKVNRPNLKKLQKEIEKVVIDSESEIAHSEIALQKRELKLVKSKKVTDNSLSDDISFLSSTEKLRTKIMIDTSNPNASTLTSIQYFYGAFMDGTTLILDHAILPESIYTNKDRIGRLIESYAIDISILAQNVAPSLLIYQFSNITYDELQLLNEKSSSGYYGDERFIQKPEALITELSAIKRARRVNSIENLSIAIPGLRSVKNFEDIVSIISSGGLHRSSNLKLYAEVSIPSFVHDFSTMAKNVIDGIIINYDSLLRLAIYRETVRDTDHIIVIHMIEELRKTVEALNIDWILHLSSVPDEILATLVGLYPTALLFDSTPSKKLLDTIRAAEEKEIIE